MKIVVACDSFKGCMTSKEANEAIKRGILKSNEKHTVICIPMADGGEGTAHVLGECLKAQKRTVLTLDAYGKKVQASYYITQDQVAIMDVASCIGLSMVEKALRNPFVVNSRGVGILMKDAIAQGCKQLIIGLGGSSTNDGGMGILQEFGVEFYNAHMHVLKANPYGLKQMTYINKKKFKKPEVDILLACDVNIHLLGENGTTYFFGKQKGFYHSQMKEVDSWMKNYSDCINRTFHVDMNSFESGGCAGGIGACLMAVFGAKHFSGAQLVAQKSNLKEEIENCDLVITGEGQTDRQTEYGKVPFEVLQIANACKKPVICLSGALGIGYQKLYDYGMAGIFSGSDRAMTFQAAIEQAEEKMENCAYSIIHLIDTIKGDL